MCDTFQLIDKLASAVSFQFKTDGTSPNVTISKLKNGYYCSVVRYTEIKGKKNAKVVVCNAQADTLESAVTQVASAFLKLAQPERNPLSELESVMKQTKPVKVTLRSVTPSGVFAEDTFPTYDGN